MPTAQMRISGEEQRLLRALSVGQAVKLPSAHRLRLELLGLLHDGPAGPRLTALGRRHAQAALTDTDAREEGCGRIASCSRETGSAGASATARTFPAVLILTSFLFRLTMDRPNEPKTRPSPSVRYGTDQASINDIQSRGCKSCPTEYARESPRCPSERGNCRSDVCP